MLAIGLGASWLWYRGQDEETRARAEELFLSLLDHGRENPYTPPELRFWLDLIADQVPLNIGRTVAPDALQGDRSFVLGGAPGSTVQLRILVNQGYIAAYNEQRRNPDWVAYRAFYVPASEVAERPERFEVDRRTRARVDPREYNNSGYDRGHLAPNYAIGLLFGEEAQLQTFLMSNILPQSPGLNRRIWRDLEARIIRRYARRFEEIWVITGPVYDRDPPRRLPSGVLIPDACFKILVDEHPQGLRALAFIIPQDVRGDEDPAQFLVSIREVEERTGLNFFTELPAHTQDALENWVARRLW